jgi:ribosome biogenesis GTPase A
MSQKIQWFPGHMHKAQKEVRELLPNIDVIIEVLDARIPFSSENPMIAQLRGDKPTLKLLNKSDLADPDRTTEWQRHFENTETIQTLVLNSEQGDRRERVLKKIREMVPHKGDATRVIHALILGIPNVGKSTLINALAGRPIAKTGNEPAVTKMQQRIKLDNHILLIDTPGMLWPNIENAHSGYRLAATGGIKETAFELADIGYYTAETLLKLYPVRIQQRYDLESLPDEHSHDAPLELLERIGQRRGCLGRGGLVDLDKTSRILLNELRSGQLGPITLETPAMMEAELKEVERHREIKVQKQAEKEAQRAEKRRRRKKR